MISQLLDRNRVWADGKTRDDSEYFSRLASGQAPGVFWVGCCDSRVIPSEIFGATLGEIFVHANIANQVRADDANTMSALGYAVGALGVADVVVCGHTQCGGVAGSLTDGDGVPAATWAWLAPLKALYHANADDLAPNDAKNQARLQRQVCELNVRAQVDTVAAADVVQAAWKKDKTPTIHGWIFNLETGLIEEICKRERD